jgi:hypothetical protein
MLGRNIRWMVAETQSTQPVRVRLSRADQVEDFISFGSGGSFATYR